MVSSGHLLDLEIMNGSKYSVKEIEVDEKKNYSIEIGAQLLDVSAQKSNI